MVGPRRSVCPRIARSSWCCIGVMPSAPACSSLHCKKRRSPIRNSSSRWKSTSVICDTIYRVTIGVRLSTIPPPRDTSTSDTAARNTTARARSRRAQARRTAFLSAIAVLLGLAGGGAAWVLIHLIGLLTNVVLFHQWGWDLPSFASFHPGPILLVEAAAGGLAVSLLAKWSPVIRGHGIPEAMEAVLSRQSRIEPRAALAKPSSAAIAIGTGGPFGAEGPIIVTGGAIGSLVGQLIS